MKRKTLWFAAVILIAFAVGCAASFTQIMYRSQATSLSTYKIINDTITDMRAFGLVSDEGWVQYAKLANNFLDRHKEVSLVMVAYKRGESPQNAVELAQRVMLVALDALKKHYIKIVPPDQQKPLF